LGARGRAEPFEPEPVIGRDVAIGVEGLEVLADDR
jgi:hypothetical protein